MSFSRYAPEDSVISSETVVRGLWSSDSNELYLASTYTSSYTEYYLDVYNGNSNSAGSSVQFSIQYGNISGSGSANINASAVGKTPSRIVYGEYRNLVYGTEAVDFSFNSDVTSSKDIFVINIARSRYKESLLPGSFNLTLMTGSAGVTSSLKLIDDSLTTNLTRYIGENKVFYLIQSGSALTTRYYGMLFPDLNIVVLNATVGSLGSISPYIAPVSTGYSTGNNHLKLFTSIVSGSGGLYPTSGSVNGFYLQSSETVSSRYFFTRVKNSEFNYTTNPSVIDDNGNLLYTSLINNPQTYVTTVGMYNDNNELLAVSKLSRPLTKDFTKEALIRIKLDY
jgi:hypothetical protein